MPPKSISKTPTKFVAKTIASDSLPDPNPLLTSSSLHDLHAKQLAVEEWWKIGPLAHVPLSAEQMQSFIVGENSPSAVKEENNELGEKKSASSSTHKPHFSAFTPPYFNLS